MSIFFVCIRCLYVFSPFVNGTIKIFRKTFNFTNFSLTDIVLFMLLFLGVIFFINSFIRDFFCSLNFCIFLMYLCCLCN